MPKPLRAGGVLADPPASASFAAKPRSSPAAIGLGFRAIQLGLAGPPPAAVYELPRIAPDPTRAGFLPEAPVKPVQTAQSPLMRAQRPLPSDPVKLPTLKMRPKSGITERPSQLKILAAVSPPSGAIEAAGPGFSGMLAWPGPSAAIPDEPKASPPAELPAEKPEAPVAIAEPEPEAEPVARPWDGIFAYWRSSPAYARGMAITIAVGLGALMLGPSLTSSASAGEQLGSWQEAVRARAEVDLQSSFQSSAGWVGKQGWERTWTFDPGGWAKPGKLALLGDSVSLTNYQFEFLGQIDSKALGFALRAIDENNYHAVKLLVVKPGPLPSLALAHYPVIDGKEGPKTQIPVPIHARSDTLYRTSVAVQGDNISVSINGQFIGSWTDDHFKSGGVGFFADKGEAARLIWVHVVDQKDFLGWLCSQVSRWTADRRETGAKQ